MNNRNELPQLSNAAAICGTGDCVGGGLCAGVAAALFLAAQIWGHT